MKDGKLPTRWRKWPKWMTCASVDLRIGGKGVSVLCTLEQQSGRRRRYKYRCLHPGLSGWRSGERRDPGESGVVRRVVTGRALPHGTRSPPPPPLQQPQGRAIAVEQHPEGLGRSRERRALVDDHGTQA